MTQRQDIIDRQIKDSRGGRGAARADRGGVSRALLAETRADASRIREEARAEGRAIIDELREQGRRRRPSRIRERGERAARGRAASRSSRRCAASSVGSPPSWPSGSSASRCDDDDAAAPDRRPVHRRPRAARRAADGGRRADARCQQGSRCGPLGARAVDSPPTRRSDPTSCAGWPASCSRVVHLLAGRAAAASDRSPTRPSMPTSGPSCSTGLLGDRVSASDRRGASRRSCGRRWSQPADLVDAADELAAQAAVRRGGAGRRPRRGRGRAVPVRPDPRRASPRCAAALTDPSLPAERKQSSCSTRLLDDKVRGPPAVADRARSSCTRAAAPSTGRSRSTRRLAAARRERLVARVRSVVPLTEEQRTGWPRAWRRSSATGCTCNVEIDPDLVGGLTVRVGDELYRRQRRPPPGRGPPPDGRLSRCAHPRLLPTEQHRPRRAGTIDDGADHPSRGDPRRPRAVRLELRAATRPTRPRSAGSSTPVTASPGSRACTRRMTNELLDFGDGVLGIALNLDVREIGCVILGDAQHIARGPGGPPHRRDPLHPGR